MSWQAYIDQMVGTKKIAKAAILGLADKAVWATSTDLSLSPEEISKLINGVQDPSPLKASGAALQGQKYVYAGSDERFLHLRTAKAGGILCVATTRTVLVGFYDANMQVGQAQQVIQNTA